MSTDELEQMDQWGKEFEDFHTRFADLFARSEPREEARQYLRGLLASVARKVTIHLVGRVNAQLVG